MDIHCTCGDRCKTQDAGCNKAHIHSNMIEDTWIDSIWHWRMYDDLVQKAFKLDLDFWVCINFLDSILDRILDNIFTSYEQSLVTGAAEATI
jgi:hypothetical protein